MKRFALVLTLVALMALPALADDHSKSCCMGMEGVTKQVTNLDNGVKITMTAKDPKVLAKLQEQVTGQHDKGCCKDCPMHAEGVTSNVEKTADGVVITATATDAALVKKLQEHAAGQGCGHDHAAKDAKGCSAHHGDTTAQGDAAGKKACPTSDDHSKSCCMGMEGVTKQVTNFDNGVKITMTAKDPKVLAKLQEQVTGQHDKGCIKDCPMHAEGVTSNVEKTADGVVITATATDAALVKKLQEHAAGQGCGHDHAAKDAKGCCSHHGDTTAQGDAAGKKACPMSEEGKKACAKPTATALMTK